MQTVNSTDGQRAWIQQCNGFYFQIIITACHSPPHHFLPSQLSLLPPPKKRQIVKNIFSCPFTPNANVQYAYPEKESCCLRSIRQQWGRNVSCGDTSPFISISPVWWEVAISTLIRINRDHFSKWVLPASLQYYHKLPNNWQWDQQPGYTWRPSRSTRKKSRSGKFREKDKNR